MFEFPKDQHHQAKERTTKILGTAADTTMPLISIQSLNKERRTVPSISENALQIKFKNHLTHLHAYFFSG